MKIIPFPGGEESFDPATVAELEAALAGADGPAARAWRELSGDIRSFAPPVDSEFEHVLLQRLSAPPVDEPETIGAARPPRSLWRWWTSRSLAPRLLSLGGAGALAALVIAVLIVGPGSGGTNRHVIAERSAPSVHAPSVQSGALATPPQRSASEAAKATAAPAPAGPALPVPAPAPGASPGRVQQLGASLTLAGSPEEVQKLADGVSRVVIAEGGFVASSQVQVERGATNSATLVVSVPSSRLSRALAALGRLGTVRAETQSLQDITSSYDSARRALGDAVAERAALLRALARATTQGEIESLHRRLALAGGAIERARSAFAQVSSQASNASLEVNVVGEAQASSGELTLDRGLHDAGRVLSVALAVLLIGLAALLPLALAGAALALTLRTLRRGARERALGGS